MWARALASLFRYGKTLKSYGKGMTRSGTRVSGKSSSGRKISGVLKKDKKGGNYVVSNLGVPTRVTAENASKMVSRAKVRSNVRKGAAIGAVAGIGTLAASKTATETSPEPTYTEKNPGGMKFSAAPKMSTKKQTFSQAFKQAYAGGKGRGTNFTWRGKKFVALTKEDTGGKTIKEYYASKKKKKKK